MSGEEYSVLRHCTATFPAASERFDMNDKANPINRRFKPQSPNYWALVILLATPVVACRDSSLASGRN